MSDDVRVNEDNLGEIELEATDNDIQEEEVKEIREDDTYIQRLKQVFIAFLPLGFTTFGGPSAHIALYQQHFVQNRKWITNEQFTELFAIGQSLPGPTSTQVAIAIGTIRAGFLGGLLAFALFALPGAIILSTVGCVLHYKFMDGDQLIELPQWVSILELGFSCVAVALVASAAWKLSQKLEGTMYTRILLLFSAAATILYKSGWLIPVLLIIGGAYSLLHIRLSNWICKRLKLDKPKDYTWRERLTLAIRLVKSFSKASSQISEENADEQDIVSPAESTTESTLQETDMNEQEAVYVSPTPTTFSPIIGGIILASFVVLFVALLVLRQFVTFKLFVLFEAFFRFGSILYGGGQVILPMIMIEFTEHSNLMTKNQFMNGFALVSALPGPMFNLSGYLGGVMGGVVGSLLSWVALFLPAFLFIWGILPFWAKFRERPIIKHILVGVNAVAIGLVFAAIYMIWSSAIEDLSKVAVSLSAVTVLVDFGLLHIANFPAPLVVLFSGGFRLLLFTVAKA